jgi:hypothetical protein
LPPYTLDRTSAAVQGCPSVPGSKSAELESLGCVLDNEKPAASAADGDTNHTSAIVAP